MTKDTLATLLAAPLVALFLYTCTSKYLDLADYVQSMKLQPLYPWLRTLVQYGLPPAEVVTALLLMWRRTRRIGFFISLGLMVSFTIYIGLGLAHVFPRVPCTCGGVFRQFSWKMHFYFNLFFIGVSLAGIRVTRPLRPRQLH
jgi:hypothetical protein